ncbi:MAG TPA: peptidylprolyl isomerase [Bryobacterales bacterium]|nr:peptidylprolyl isomerase [Bryobacterales bacterium]
MRKFLILPLAGWLALPLAAAPAPAAAPAATTPKIDVIEEIIAKINGEIVTRSEMERQMAEARAELDRQKLSGAELDKALAEHQKDILRDLVDQSLLVQKAKELNISVEADVIKRLDQLRRQYNVASMEEFEKFVTEKGGMHFEDLRDQIRNQLLTERVIQQEVGRRINISHEDIAKYYDEHKPEFVRPEEVRLQQILISTEGKDPKEIAALEKKANDTLARLKKGERFGEVASKVSDDKDSAQMGGDIGFWKRGVLDKQIEDMVFNAKRGFISDVLKRPNGFLILRVEERHQAGQAKLEDVEQEIQEKLYYPKMQPALRAYLTQLRQNAFIEIRPGFVDSGAAPGIDTTWKDPEQFKPAVTTKAEATRRKKRLLWVVPRRNKAKEDYDTQSLGERPAAAAAPGASQGAEAPPSAAAPAASPSTGPPK